MMSLMGEKDATGAYNPARSGDQGAQGARGAQGAQGARGARIQRMKLTCRLLVFASILSIAQGSTAQTPQTITVTSPMLKEGETIPRQYTPDGRNDSPPLAWSGVPAAAKELAVVCEDPDAGNPPPFVHWVVYSIPATATGLPEALPIDSTTKMPADLVGTVQGTN